MYEKNFLVTLTFMLNRIGSSLSSQFYHNYRRFVANLSELPTNLTVDLVNYSRFKTEIHLPAGHKEVFAKLSI